MPNRQPRADGQLVSLDSKSLYHEAKAAGITYQATLRHLLHAERGFEFHAVDPHTGPKSQGWTPIAMASDAFDAYLIDRAAERDALLIWQIATVVIRLRYAWA